MSKPESMLPIIRKINSGEHICIHELELMHTYSYDGWFLVHWAARVGNKSVLSNLINNGFATLSTEALYACEPEDITPSTILKKYHPSLFEELFTNLEKST
jgi:hypothetical protein